MIKENQYSHDRLVSECFLYTWNQFEDTRRLVFHPNNETRPFKGESQAAYMKRLSLNFALGVVAGVLDLVFYWKGRLHVFDIKIGNDRVSKEQQEFAEQVVKNGGTAHTIINLEQFKEVFLRLYMSSESP